MGEDFRKVIEPFPKFTILHPFCVPFTAVALKIFRFTRDNEKILSYSIFASIKYLPFTYLRGDVRTTLSSSECDLGINESMEFKKMVF